MILVIRIIQNYKSQIYIKVDNIDSQQLPPLSSPLGRFGRHENLPRMTDGIFNSSHRWIK